MEMSCLYTLMCTNSEDYIAMSTVILSLQYVNQSESQPSSFSELSGDKWCLQRKYMCRQHKTLHCIRKLHKKLSNSYQRSGKGHVTTEWHLSVTFLARGRFLFFNWYLKLGKKIPTFLMVGSAKFLSRKIFLLGAILTINNDRSLIACKKLWHTFNFTYFYYPVHP